MKYWLGVTDNSWFTHQEKNRFDEVNFWQPSATPPFKNAPLGLPFLFKLKSPNNHIAGGGFFVTYSTLPLDLAWNVFGSKNGTNSYNELTELITPLSKGASKQQMIGCTILANPFFFPRDSWIPTPKSFSPNIVRGKMYDTNHSDGSELWQEVNHRLNISSDKKPQISSISEQNSPKYGKEQLIKPRLGQGSFRLLVTEAYKRRCAITGESTLPVLEAAHIIPYSESGNHEVSNGLLLRADFHKLYDSGLVSITPDLEIKISPRIREAWFNGKSYYRLHNHKLASTPDLANMMPDRDALSWHHNEKFISD